jgi:hypothetical protein
MTHHNIMLITVDLEDFSHKVVQVPADHAAVKFCEDWKAAGGNAYVQVGFDEEKYNNMWHELDELEEIALPCEVHHCIHGVVV